MFQYKVDYDMEDEPHDRSDFPIGPRAKLAMVAAATLKRLGYEVEHKEGEMNFYVKIPIEEKDRRILDKIVTYPFGVLKVK